MLTPTRLFFIRLRQHVRFITKSVNSVLDWSVWLYFVIPLLVIGIGLYVDLWRQFPQWATPISWEWVLIVVFSLFIGGAKPFVGVAEADQLVLLQHARWLKVLKQWGLLYSFLMNVISHLFIMFLLLPFLVQAGGYRISSLLPLFLYSLAAMMIMLTISRFFYKRGRWWMRLLRSVVRSLITAIIWIVPASGYVLELWNLNYILIAASAVMIFTLLRYAAAPVLFAQQLQQEQAFRMNLTGVLLSQVHEPRSNKRLKKPWVFRKSQRLFKRSGQVYAISELRIKGLLRSLSVLQVGLSIIGVGSYAIILVDGMGALIVVAGLLFVKRTWLHLQWEQWSKEQYLQLYLTDQQSTKRAKQLSANLLMLPGLLIWLIVFFVTI